MSAASAHAVDIMSVRDVLCNLDSSMQQLEQHERLRDEEAQILATPHSAHRRGGQRPPHWRVDQKRDIKPSPGLGWPPQPRDLAEPVFKHASQEVDRRGTDEEAYIQAPVAWAMMMVTRYSRVSSTSLNFDGQTVLLRCRL